MEAEPPVGCLYGLENLRMTVAERVCRPTILEVDVAFAVEIPDEVAVCLVNNDLPYRTKSALAGSFHFGIEPQAILEKRNAAFERRACFWTWESIIHNMHPRNFYSHSLAQDR